jgi:methionyl-tRNA synthetase
MDEESLLGRRVVVLTNLPPRKMMGLQSQGMMLVAEDADGKLSPLGPADDVAPGSKIS